MNNESTCARPIWAFTCVKNVLIKQRSSWLGKKNHFIHNHYIKFSVLLRLEMRPIQELEPLLSQETAMEPVCISVSVFFSSFLFTPFLLLTQTIPPWLPAIREQRSLIVLWIEGTHSTHTHTDGRLGTHR